MAILVAVTRNQGWQYGTVRLNFCYEVRYTGAVRFFCNGTGTVRWYGKLQKLTELRYAGTIRFKVRGT